MSFENIDSLIDHIQKCDLEIIERLDVLATVMGSRFMELTNRIELLEGRCDDLRHRLYMHSQVTDKAFRNE